MGVTATGVEPLQGRHRAAADALVDMAMRPGAEISMTEDFPLMVGPRARSRRYVIRDGDAVVAHAAGLTLEVRPEEDEALKLFNIGAVATSPAARGRGFGTALLDTLLEEAEATGHAAAILWTDIPGFYERRGFHWAGGETRFHVIYDQMPASTWIGVRPMREEDLPEILQLRRADPAPVWRPWSEAQTLFALPMSETWVAHDDRGRLIGYAVYGKGLDFPHMIHEWAGPPSLLPSLVRAVLIACDTLETVLFGPRWNREFVDTFAGLVTPRMDEHLALMKVLDRPALESRLIGEAPESDEELLHAVFGDTSDRTPAIPFYVWGLDSN